MADNADPAGELTMLLDDDVVDVEDYGAERSADDADGTPAPRAQEPMSAVRRATLLGLAVAAHWLFWWDGWDFAPPVGARQRPANQFLQVARQGALNLTTSIGETPKRCQRILDGATGQFYHDFAKRSQPFVDVVKKPTTTVGTITERLDRNGRSAQVLVAVTVRTSNVGAPQPDPHAWRIRISVQKVGDQAKVSNVEFVA